MESLWDWPRRRIHRRNVGQGAGRDRVPGGEKEKYLMEEKDDKWNRRKSSRKRRWRTKRKRKTRSGLEKEQEEEKEED